MRLRKYAPFENSPIKTRHHRKHRFLTIRGRGHSLAISYIANEKEQ